MSNYHGQHVNTVAPPSLAEMSNYHGQHVNYLDVNRAVTLTVPFAHMHHKLTPLMHLL